ncbi:S4 domain-containing protein [Acuticoccus sp. MNP-M23]|uniref:RNA-binding S4 domain-containing protein n=1 Tax=Acuticoccus sp. MNP-M23 TaxID=3072793 RepID=UPI002815BDC7|nr:S4 domain-containing protein [Acuticoccus sp. MNP-M23]WMS44963.1 S4 domain-containing protein [Acuticoccus sp. MNP-M23]
MAAQRTEADEAPEPQRLDKWLTYARFVKTRTLAQALVAGGKVRLNRDKVTDSARKVRVDDILTIRIGKLVHVVKVVGFAPSRVSPPETVNLYLRLDQPTAEGAASVRNHPRSSHD